MLLTDDERQRFIAWLERDADSSELIARQMEGNPATAVLAKMLRTELMAERIVARKLRNTESQSVSR